LRSIDPKFLAYDGDEKPDYARSGDVFFRGVDSPSKGAQAWNKAIDPTVWSCATEGALSTHGGRFAKEWLADARDMQGKKAWLT
jgi:hypothetical protein